jgi:hypothetical protein
VKFWATNWQAPRREQPHAGDQRGAPTGAAEKLTNAAWRG